MRAFVFHCWNSSWVYENWIGWDGTTVRTGIPYVTGCSHCFATPSLSKKHRRGGLCSSWLMSPGAELFILQPLSSQRQDTKVWTLTSPSTIINSSLLHCWSMTYNKEPPVSHPTASTCWYTQLPLSPLTPSSVFSHPVLSLQQFLPSPVSSQPIPQPVALFQVAWLSHFSPIHCGYPSCCSFS